MLRETLAWILLHAGGLSAVISHVPTSHLQSCLEHHTVLQLQTRSFPQLVFCLRTVLSFVQ